MNSSIEGIGIITDWFLRSVGNIRRISSLNDLEHFWPEFMVTIYTGIRSNCWR